VVVDFELLANTTNGNAEMDTRAASSLPTGAPLTTAMAT
jgi:hypothetical protein